MTSWKIGKTYLTRGGKTVRVLATDIKGTKYPLVVAIPQTFFNGRESLVAENVIRLHADGTAFGPDTPNSNDLVPATIKLESRGWLRIWERGGKAVPYLAPTRGNWELGFTDSCGYKLVHLEEIVRVVEVPTE